MLEAVAVEAAVAAVREAVEDPIEEADTDTTGALRSGTLAIPPGVVNMISCLTRTIIGGTRVTAMSAAAGIGIDGTARIRGGSGVEVAIGIGTGMGESPRVDMNADARDLGVHKIVEIGIETGDTAIGGEEWTVYTCTMPQICKSSSVTSPRKQ